MNFDVDIETVGTMAFVSRVFYLVGRIVVYLWTNTDEEPNLATNAAYNP